MRLWPTNRYARILVTLALIFVIYSVGTFFGVPALVKYVARNQGAAALHRQVMLDEVKFNPYKLRLLIDHLRVTGRDTPSAFVEADQVNLRLSWTSLYRLALVVKQFTLERPTIHATRLGPRIFDFSDLLTPSSTPKKSGGAFHFAVSNIEVIEGRITFDDQVLKQQHRIDHLRLAIPFIANLPTDVDIYVQPLLEMTIDGSPFKLTGKTKPFGHDLESLIDLNFQKLDLVRFVDYAAAELPAKVTQAELSAAVQLHFVQTGGHPRVAATGTVSLENVAIRDRSNAPLVELKQLQLAMADVEPLESKLHLSSINIDSLTPHVMLYHGGTTNLTSLTRPSAPRAVPSSSATIVSHYQGSPPQSSPVPQIPASQSSQGLPSSGSGPSNQAAQLPATPQQSAPVQTPPVQAPNASPTMAALPTQTANMPPTPTPGPSAVTNPTPGQGSNPLASPTASLLVNPMLTAPSPESGASPAPTATAEGNKLAFAVDSLQLNNSMLDVIDQSGAQPVNLQLKAIHLGVANLTNAAGAAGSYDMSANLSGGGGLSANGKIDVSSLRATSKLTLAQVDLPALQGFMRPALAALIASGKLSGQATVQAALGQGHFNIHAEPAQLALDMVEIRTADEKNQPGRTRNGSPARTTTNPIGWRHFSVDVAQIDLASHQAIVREVRSDGLHLAVQRDRQGNVNLKTLVATPPNSPPSPQARPAASTPATAPSWQYRIDSIALENTAAAIEDDSQRQPLTVQIVPLNLHLSRITNDLAKPVTIEADGKVGSKGTFKIAGDTTITPLKARLHIDSRRLDLSPLTSFIAASPSGKNLNVKIAKVELTMNGDAEAQLRGGKINAGYRGGVRLGNVQVLDKLTGESLLRWYALALDGIALRYGTGKPRVNINGVALSNFYARVILNSNGRLNLRDISSSPGQPAQSVTRPAAAPSPEPAPAAIPANIAIGGITLQSGQVSYIDNFIRPNYSAELTELEGKVGAVGTGSTRPADVVIAGKVNGDSPLSISGSINPLAPMAAVDIKASAERIELTPLAPYTTKYTGYPITGGTLTGDIHYVLANQQLTAENHLILDQLTFGDRVQNSTARNLPIRLAVAVLKDSQGRIDLRIPISGSLSDPQFSIGQMVLGALMNIIVKAATAPFTLLASAIGGSNQQLSYIEFSPGYSTLTPAAKSKLAKLAAALKDRPKLKLEIIGRVDPRVDSSGLQAATIENAIKKQKAESAHVPGPVELVPVTPDEYNHYLWRVYKAADFAKPRDVVGMVKRLPPEEIKKLLIANVRVSDQDLQRLAEARANAVAHELGGAIDSSRLAIAAPKLTAEGIPDNGPTTRVDFSLK